MFFWQFWMESQKELDDRGAFRAILSCLPLDGCSVYHAPFIHAEFSQDFMETVFKAAASRRAIAISLKKGVEGEQHRRCAVYTVRPRRTQQCSSCIPGGGQKYQVHRVLSYHTHGRRCGDATYMCNQWSTPKTDAAHIRFRRSHS